MKRPALPADKWIKINRSGKLQSILEFKYYQQPNGVLLLAEKNIRIGVNENERQREGYRNRLLCTEF